MANFAVISDWFSARTLDDLLNILQVGDLLEFDRVTYKHWAVCIRVKDKVLVVHRTGTDSTSVLTIHSHSVNKQKHGVGAICKEPLKEVLENDKVRINNSHDKKRAPKSATEIAQYAIRAIDNDDFGVYNLATNNCEHFAKLCRNDHKCSQQVQQVTTGVTTTIAAAGLVMGAAYLLFGRTGRKEKSHSNWQTESDSE